MSKYDPLWNWIKENGTDSFKLTFAEIEQIAGIPIDHSFLNFKKELLNYGFKVGKISLKEQTVSLYSHSPEGRSAADKAGYPESHQEDRGVTI